MVSAIFTSFGGDGGGNDNEIYRWSSAYDHSWDQNLGC